MLLLTDLERALLAYDYPVHLRGGCRMVGAIDMSKIPRTDGGIRWKLQVLGRIS